MVNSTGVNSIDELWVPASGPPEAPSTTNQLQNDLTSNGYTVIRDVLTPEQV
jgi:hypothetical protein